MASLEPQTVRIKTKAPPAAPEKLYTVGTLSYTKRGIMVLFMWLLWGGFCFQLFETCPSILSLKLHELDASKTVISAVTFGIPAWLGTIITPIVSFKSDRYRGRWGRRIPFLFWATPFMAAFMMLVGFAPQLGFWLQKFLLSFVSVSPNTIAIALITAFYVCFCVSNLFVTSIWAYLLADVVPLEFQAKFISFFQTVSTAITLCFNFFIMKYSMDYMAQIFTGAAVIYLVGFWITCWRVKEGQYPPPPVAEAGRRGFIASFQLYFKECFCHRLYVYFFLASFFFGLANAMNVFGQIFWRTGGMSLDMIGKLGAVRDLFPLILYPLLGMFTGLLMHKWRPFRVVLICMIGQMVVWCFRGIYLFWSPVPMQFWVSELCVVVSLYAIGVFYTVAGAPLTIQFFPRDQFGQFSSANAMMRNIGVTIGGIGTGIFMDLVTTFFPRDGYCFRFMFIWVVVFFALGNIFLYWCYRGYLRRGGPDNYVPPPVS
jgi:maltose/moltooligosaccharide transporter